MPTQRQWDAARARALMNAALRRFFAERGYLEVETPALVPTPGQEPHIDALRGALRPRDRTWARARSL